jgi:putative hydrolase of HD superfamily
MPDSSRREYREVIQTMSAENIVDLMVSVHPLDRVPRAGYLLRGVTEPESVAAHSHSLALLALLVCKEHPGEFDTLKAVEMAVLHDLQEVVTMDIPLPAGTEEFKRAKDAAEGTIFDELFSGVTPSLRERHAEFQAADSPEAKLVRGLDKVQLMIKVLCYEREGRGRLDDFWNHRHNFPDYDLPVLKDLFDAVARKAGRRVTK